MYLQMHIEIHIYYTYMNLFIYRFIYIIHMHVFIYIFIYTGHYCGYILKEYLFCGITIAFLWMKWYNIKNEIYFK